MFGPAFSQAIMAVYGTYPQKSAQIRQKASRCGSVASQRLTGRHLSGASVREPNDRRLQPLWTTVAAVAAIRHHSGR